jgi:hypothetical protein
VRYGVVLIGRSLIWESSWSSSLIQFSRIGIDRLSLKIASSRTAKVWGMMKKSISLSIRWGWKWNMIWSARKRPKGERRCDVMSCVINRKPEARHKWHWTLCFPDRTNTCQQNGLWFRKVEPFRLTTKCSAHPRDQKCPDAKSFSLLQKRTKRE